MNFQTAYDFTLPKGYVDEAGIVHRQGTMRLATAGDEIHAMQHPKVRQNPDYASFVVISSVITQLEGCDRVTPEMLEKMYLSDINFLQNMYQTIHESEIPTIHVVCPHCGKEFTDTLNFTNQK